MMLSDSDKTKISQTLDLLSKTAQEMAGPELRKAREAAGLSVMQVSRLTLLTPMTIHEMEAEARTPAATLLIQSHAFILNQTYGLPIRRAKMPWETTAQPSPMQRSLGSTPA